MSERPKYRILSKEELTLLEPEFVLFLSSQNITATEWQDLKQNQAWQVEELILKFSDLVFEKILGKIDLMERRLRDQLMFFHFSEKYIEMIGIHIMGCEDVDLRSFDSKTDMAKWLNNTSCKTQIISATKRMNISRHEEMLAMINMGCEISKNYTLYELLTNLRKETQ